MELGFVVFGVPISANNGGHSKQDWKARVGAGARASIREEDLFLHGDLRGTIVYFHQGECDLDVDNIAKPKGF